MSSTTYGIPPVFGYTSDATKLNLGCGHYPIEGFLNIDIEDPADHVGDFTLMAFHNVEEVEMSHVLEHISWQRTDAVLALIRSWMRPGGKFRVEVPDMEVILGAGEWSMAVQIAIYGIQSAPGEFHRAGFTWPSLRAALIRAGFICDVGKTFASEHEQRVGFPCLEAIGIAG